MKSVKIGDVVKVVDELGVEHNALVTEQWGGGDVKEYDDTEGKSVHLAINVVFLSADPAKRDCYGRQSEHLSSVSHRNDRGSCPGRYWWQP